MSDVSAQCRACSGHASGFCAGFGAQDRAELAAMRLPDRAMPAGSDIYRQGEVAGAYTIVRSGWVALSVLLDDGRRHIYDFALPGTFLGLVAAPSPLLTHTARCITDVHICSLARPQFNAFLERRPQVLQRLLHTLIDNEKRIQDHFVNVTGRPARDRLANLMVELFVRVHRRLPKRSGDQVAIPLTQACIGEAIGLTPVHVSRTFSTLQDEGLARFTRGLFTILDPDRLLEASGSAGGSHGRPSTFGSHVALGAARPPPT